MGTDAVTRHAFWMPSRRGWRASWLHVPGGARQRAGGVVICAPMGHEYTHSYRTLLHLADRLAEAGMLALRFDYHGCGSSAGDLLDDDLVGAWVEDIRAATALVARLTGGPASVIGLRLGATLAAVAAQRCEIEHFVAWAPVPSGRRYLREQKALAEVTGATLGPGGHVLDAGGFVLSKEAAAELGSIDLRKQECRVRGGALVLERDDLGRAPGPHEWLRGEAGATEAEAAEATGFAEMMQKPHLTVVPHETIERIVRWLEVRARPDASAAWRLPTETSMASTLEGVRVVEELVHVPGSPPLFGILTKPLTRVSEDRPLLLLANGGSAHNVGPNRVYVEMSRRLAAAGFPSLRLDLRNLGDSIRGHADEENHPYPSTATADVSRAIEWLVEERGVERVVLGGLCSGAHHAFRCGVELPHPAIEGLLLINPLTFRWSGGSSRVFADEAGPHAGIRDARKWRKLKNGEYDVRKILRFAFDAARARGLAAATRALDRLGLLAPRVLDWEILRCVASDRRIDFVYSRHDPGYGLLRASTGRTLGRLEREGALSISFVEGSDHSFSRRAWREDLVSLVGERMTLRYCGRSGSADLSSAASWRSSMPRAFATASS